MKEVIKKHIKSIAIVEFLFLICNILAVLHPYILKEIIDIDFKDSNAEKTILILFGTYLIIHIALVIMRYVEYVKNNKLIATILKDIREKVFCKVMKFKMKTYNKYNSSEIYTRLTNDVDNLFNLFFVVLETIINNVAYIILMLVMMFFANIELGLIGCVTIIITGYASLKFTKKLKSLDDKILQKRDEENREFSEMYNKNKLTYLYKMQNDNIKATSKLLDEELKIRRKYIFVHHFMYPVAIILEALGIYAILYYALNINLNISIGSIYLVLFYVKECRTPLNQLFDRLEEMQTCLNSLRRINSILREKDDEDIYTGEDAKDLNGDIEFKNVYMKYGREPVLKDISFVIKKGSKVTIAGRTGVGKSTLTNIFMRLYDIQSGQILMNGYDISKISIKSLRDNISYISQNPYIFEDTLRNNITLGDNNISDEQILDIVEHIGVKDIFSRFTNGLDEVIKDKKLSYGELQVVSFIRAIVHKSNIYIFDEPTSNIDLKTERLIQDVIDKISENSTVIIVAHRKSTLESSNKIIYLKDGQVDMIVNK